MKKLISLISIICLSISLLSCAAINKANLKQKLENITAEGIVSCDDPLEVHELAERALNKVVHFARHNNCMGIDEMIVIGWSGETPDKLLNSVRELVFTWAEWMTKSLKGEYSITVTELKRDEIYFNDADISLVFFEVTRKRRWKSQKNN